MQLDGERIASEISTNIKHTFPGVFCQVIRYDVDHLFTEPDDLIWLVFIDGQYSGGFYYDKHNRVWTLNTAESFCDLPDDLLTDTAVKVKGLILNAIS